MHALHKPLRTNTRDPHTQQVSDLRRRRAAGVPEEDEGAREEEARLHARGKALAQQVLNLLALLVQKERGEEEKWRLPPPRTRSPPG